MLIQQMSIQYSQPIRRIYEIGPWASVTTGAAGGAAEVGQPVYFVAGRCEGQLQLNRIAGPVAALGGFYRNYGSVCNLYNSLFFVSSSGCIGPLPTGSSAFTGGAGTITAVGGTPADRVISSGQANPYLGWYLNGVVITSIGLQAQAQDMMVAEATNCQFVALRLFTNNGNATGLSTQGTTAGSITANGWTEI
jgi:hypothetical protein